MTPRKKKKRVDTFAAEREWINLARALHKQLSRSLEDDSTFSIVAFDLCELLDPFVCSWDIDRSGKNLLYFPWAAAVRANCPECKTITTLLFVVLVDPTGKEVRLRVKDSTPVYHCETCKEGWLVKTDRDVLREYAGQILPESDLELDG